jgi:hypothetical protein
VHGTTWNKQQAGRIISRIISITQLQAEVANITFNGPMTTAT